MTISESLGVEFEGVDLNHDQRVLFMCKPSMASPNIGAPTIGHTVFGHVENYPEIFSVYQAEQ